MKKQFEEVKMDIYFMSPQDIVTASVYVEWDDKNWSSNDEKDYIFG
jgi:hypothetical protein